MRCKPTLLVPGTGRRGWCRRGATERQGRRRWSSFFFFFFFFWARTGRKPYRNNIKPTQQTWHEKSLLIPGSWVTYFSMRVPWVPSQCWCALTSPTTRCLEIRTRCSRRAACRTADPHDETDNEKNKNYYRNPSNEKLATEKCLFERASTSSCIS